MQKTMFQGDNYGFLYGRRPFYTHSQTISAEMNDIFRLTLCHERQRHLRQNDIRSNNASCPKIHPFSNVKCNTNTLFSRFYFALNPNYTIFATIF